MRNISKFIFNFNYIKDLAKITMDEKCNGIYCEAETDRYQIAKNSYNLLMPNDIFNSKSYIIFVFIISIMIFIYYYRMMELNEYKSGFLNITLYILIHALLLTILLWMIIYRYIPYDEQGYLNYFKNKWDNGNEGNDGVDKIIKGEDLENVKNEGNGGVDKIIKGEDLENVKNDNNIRIVVIVVFVILFISIIIIIIFFNNQINEHKYKVTAIVILLIIWGIFMCLMYLYIPYTFDILYVFLISLIPLFVVLLKWDILKKIISSDTDIDERTKGIILIIYIACFIASIFLLIYLMNIVMSFRNNTTPILKTKPLSWSLRNSLNNHVDYRITDTDNKNIITEYDKIKIYKDSLGTNISSVLDVYIAFEELSKIAYNSLTIPETYRTKLKDTINKSDIYNPKDDVNMSKLSLIFDGKKVLIPNDYGDITNKEDERLKQNPEFSSSHIYNSNDRNANYVYTADISYDNPNLFYEKYWDMKDTDYEFLWRYDYGLPTFFQRLLKGGKPNLTKLLVSLSIFIGICIFILIIISYFSNFEGFLTNFFNILAPLIAFAILIVYIIIFIRFNTNFNKNVVYKCLDCSYKRSLNKLNTIVSPYIRMYDNKITSGNKNYTQHYIIANVFYSILSGNINLADTEVTITSINDDNNNYIYIFDTKYKLADMNSNILTDENLYREFYKKRFKNLYKERYDSNDGDNMKGIDNIYNVFEKIFRDEDANKKIGNTENRFEIYFQSIFKRPFIRKIYHIIKRCIQLFEEEEFNNKNKDTSATYRDTYEKFKFYQSNDKLIPHKFILILKTKAEVDKFIEYDKDTITTEFNNILLNKLNIQSKGETADMTSILTDITDEESTNQNKDIQSKCIIKIIAKYLLIMGHINYNRIEYKAITGTTEEDKEKKKNIYTLNTLKLYQLISNVSYADTFNIDDTFGKDEKTKIGFLTDEKYEKYKKLTYMYNYLDTKYNILSSNNNKNYLINIIKSINNTLNNDNKTIDLDDIKESRYLFSDRIKEIDMIPEYEDEKAILNKAQEISTTTFEGTYFGNMLIILFYIIGTIFFKIK